MKKAIQKKFTIILFDTNSWDEPYELWIENDTPIRLVKNGFFRDPDYTFIFDILNVDFVYYDLRSTIDNDLCDNVESCIDDIHKIYKLLKPELTI